MEGNQVPQELVTNVGITFEQILEEVCLLHIHLLLIVVLVFCCTLLTRFSSFANADQ